MMRPGNRLAYGTPPASGHRLDVREPIAVPAFLHIEGAEPRAVIVADLTPRGCRVTVASDLPIAAHLALVLDGANLISGRVAWNDGCSIGVDFCAVLLPRIVGRLMRSLS